MQCCICRTAFLKNDSTAEERREEEVFALASIAHYCFVEIKSNCGIQPKKNNNGKAQMFVFLLASKWSKSPFPKVLTRTFITGHELTSEIGKKLLWSTNGTAMVPAGWFLSLNEGWRCCCACWYDAWGKGRLKVRVEKWPRPSVMGKCGLWWEVWLLGMVRGRLSH